MTSPLAYINDACFDLRTRFGFSDFCIGSEHISRMRPALSGSTWGRFFHLVGHACRKKPASLGQIYSTVEREYPGLTRQESERPTHCSQLSCWGFVYGGKPKTSQSGRDLRILVHREHLAQRHEAGHFPHRQHFPHRIDIFECTD
jgi:hypothetical protein